MDKFTNIINIVKEFFVEKNDKIIGVSFFIIGILIAIFSIILIGLGTIIKSFIIVLLVLVIFIIVSSLISKGLFFWDDEQNSEEE